MRRRTRGRWLVVVVVALGLHAVLWVLLDKVWRPGRVRRRPRVLRLVALPPSSLENPPTGQAQQLPERSLGLASPPAAMPSRAPRSSERQSAPSVPEASAVARRQQLPRRQAPDTVELFPQAVIGEIAAGAPKREQEPDGAALAEQRLERWRQGFAERQRAQVGVPRGLKAMGERFADWFIPETTSLARVGRFGIGALSQLDRYIRAFHQGEHLELMQAASDGGPGYYAGLEQAEMLLVCFGACQHVDHEVARLETTVDVEHDPDGMPASWHVSQSSGDPVFDAEALSAVAYVAANGATDVLTEDEVASWTRWLLIATAYRYSRGELLADPTFVPPGKRIDQESGFLGVTTMTRKAVLVAVRLRPADG